MRKDEKEILQAQLELEKLAIERLKENYKIALKDIDEKLAALLGRSDSNLQSVIYQVEHQQRLRTQVKAALDQLQANEFETISEYLAECYEDGFESALYSMQEQGVPLMFPVDEKQVAEAIQLDSKISEGLYKRLGKDIGELKKSIASVIARGISTSMKYSQIAKNLNRTADIGLYRAMRITRTEGGRIQNKAAMDAMQKAADNGAQIMKKWSAALDARTRDSHVKVDGEIRELNKPFSNGLMYPKDPSGVAREVCNCRCRVQQKAKWALEANETKMLGNVSDMTDAQKERIAKKLGIPVDELQNYSKQIVPIKAKSYTDFRNKYNELWHYEGSDLQKEAEARIASYKRKSSGKVLEKSGKSSTIESGAKGALTSQNDPRFKKRKAHAKQYYEGVRNSDGQSIITNVSKNSGIAVEDVTKAINHLFYEKHDLEKGYTYFEEDYDISESIRRLREGKNIQAHDLILIRHEAMEADYMKSGMAFEEAHAKTEEQFNYTLALRAFLKANGLE